MDQIAVRVKRGGRFHSEFPEIQRPGTPIATGRTADPAAPFSSSGRIMVHEVQTLSFASASSLEFSMW